jgi:error-prone DNA polymerase
MPEAHDSKRPIPSIAAAASPLQACRYAELRCRTNFSFLEGASHGDELASRAAELGLHALAITDRNALSGVVRAHVAAKQAKVKLLIGAELTPVDGSPLLVWAQDRSGYAHLSRLLTVGRRAAPKGECRLTIADIGQHTAGLLAGALLADASGADLRRYREMFGDRCYAVAELARGPHDRRLLAGWLRAAASCGLSVVAANDVHYHEPGRRPLQEILAAIRLGCTVAELGAHRFANGERRLKSPAEMARLFADAPHAVERTVEVADRCTFSLDELKYEYPEELSSPGLTPMEFLTRLAWDGAKERYPRGLPDKIRKLIDYELALIAELNYEAYFLTVWDLVRFARGRGILCQGRGSAANSAVCYCLGITSVDPDRIDLLFERFISRERDEAPDIDVDFEHERREEVLQYLYAKYGRDRVGMTAEVITYQARSAVRDAGKALGLSLDRVDQLSKAMDHRHDEAKLRRRFQEAGFAPDSFLGDLLVRAVEQMVHFPRHLSQHTGGMIVSRGPLCELVPIENAAMPDRTVVQWDKNDLDALGMLKVDCLALGMLTAIRKGFELIERHKGRALTLATVPAEEVCVYDMIGKADTIGVFQIESRAQMSMLPRLKPRCFYDLVIEVAIVRPGPIQGDMVHPYLRRRRGDEPVDYPSEAIRAVLEKTLGVPIFQEQAMRLAVVAAGFTPGEADQLRRAMGAWRKRGVMEPFRDKLTRGMLANGYAAEFAERLYKQICGFGEYGFPESHAASFALLVYVSAWIKHHHPDVFVAALLNSQPLGFYAPAQLIADARKHGVTVRGLDINHSDWDCTLEPAGSVLHALRLGFRMVQGMAMRHAETILRQRTRGAFRSFDDFRRRTGFSSAILQQLARADAFTSMGLDRRAALWRALAKPTPMPLFDHLPDDEADVELPAMSPLGEVLADYGAAGFSLREHPVSFLRSLLDERGVASSARLSELPHGSPVVVAGLVLLRQRPSTAKGITFVTLEDETGTLNLIVRQPVWEKHRLVARSATMLLVEGFLQREGEVVHVLVVRMEDWSSRFANLDTRSRDFR